MGIKYKDKNFKLFRKKQQGAENLSLFIIV